MAHAEKLDGGQAKGCFYKMLFTNAKGLPNAYNVIFQSASKYFPTISLLASSAEQIIKY